jgi:predicted nucleic acid-binding protein
MTISIDTNVIAALWNVREETHQIARRLLDAACKEGRPIIMGCVYAELLAGPGRSVSMLDEFLTDTGTNVEWDVGEPVWRLAGERFQQYAERRRKSGGGHIRRILVDFLVGAHAERRGHTLLTLDKRLYRAAYPRLKLFSLIH